VGIVVPEPMIDAVTGALVAADVAFADGRSALELGDGVAVVLPDVAKGLEFDAVIVVEPAAIARVGDRGLRLLFIALTRAVRSLTVAHIEPLPAPLAGRSRAR
jgi:hypothetical protein